MWCRLHMSGKGEKTATEPPTSAAGPGGRWADRRSSNADRLFFSSELEAAHAAGVKHDAQVRIWSLLCGTMSAS